MTEDPDAGELLMRATRALRRRWLTSLEPWQLTPHEFRALRAVGQGPSRLSDLAETLHIANRSVTDVVDTLQEKGLVERTPSPSDRRAIVISLTEQGRSLTGRIAQARTEAQTAFLAPLTDAETAQLAHLLSRLLESSDIAGTAPDNV